MTEHRSTSFRHSCLKVPVDPYSRQPTPLYERPRCPRSKERRSTGKPRGCGSSCARAEQRRKEELESAREDYYKLLEFVESIPDYMEIHHLTNEEFKQKLDYLKRKQRILLNDLRNCLERDEKEDAHAKVLTTGSRLSADRNRDRPKSTCDKLPASPRVSPEPELRLHGRRCSLEESRTATPSLCPYGHFSCLAEDQDFLTYRCKKHEKEEKTRRNEEMFTTSKIWSGSESGESKSGEGLESDEQDPNAETKSLPARSPKRCTDSQPHNPFSCTLRDDAEKYVTMIEKEAEEEYMSLVRTKRNPAKKRRIRPVPLTSKIPLYDKLVAEKEERSRLVREESALNLMSQVRPFKLECDRRASRTLSRSSPELSDKKLGFASRRFRARPVPRSLFSTDLYERMLENEYSRNLQKRIRAVELMRTSSLPPSMARRSRCKSSASSRSHKSLSEERIRSVTECERNSCERSRGSSLHLERSRASTTGATTTTTTATTTSATTSLPPGNNLAAILRAQVSREKLEREIQERLEEKRRDQMLKLRKTLIGRKPAWRALRTAARHEHERDLDFRTSLRRDEAREQAVRHRIQMEKMLDRVTRIPTLFERYSQNFQSSLRLYPELYEYPRTEASKRKKKKPATKRQSPSSAESYASPASTWRPNSGSLTSSSGTPPSLYRPFRLGYSHNCSEKKRHYRRPLKVSINDKAELIEDVDYREKTFSEYTDHLGHSPRKSTTIDEADLHRKKCTIRRD